MMETLKSVLTSFKNEEGLKRRKQGLTLIETTSPTNLGPKLKNNWSQKTSLTFHVERPVQRYGRLKLKFLCERFVFIASVQMN